MTGRYGPPLSSLNYNLAFTAENLMRLEDADPHHGRGRDRSTRRPDRLMHPSPTMSQTQLSRAREDVRIS